MAVLNMSVQLAGANVFGNLSNPALWEQFVRAFLEATGREIENLTKEYLINVANFKNSQGKMKESIKAKQDAASIFVYFDPFIAPHAINVVKGVLPHQMRYLLGARKQTPTNYLKRRVGAPSPIPVAPQKGIFRWATEKSMQRGAWMHPGYEGKDVFGWVATRLRDTMAQHAGTLTTRIALGQGV